MNLRALKAPVAAALLLTAAAACSDPTVYPKSTVTSATIWTDPHSYEAYTAKMYAGLILTGQIGPNASCFGCGDIAGIDEGTSEFLRLLWYMEELPTDEAVIGWTDAGVPEMNSWEWSATNTITNAMYYRVYYEALLANEFLRQTTASALSSRGVDAATRAEIQHYRAEARFLRAFAYWVGIDMFGDIPLVTDADPIGGAPPKQVARDSIYRYVVSELIAIADSLPPANATNYGRATPMAAHLLLANLYLNAGVYTNTPNWSGALTEAQTIITSNQFSLNPVFRNNFTADNNLSPEIIFAAVQDGTHTQTWGGMTFLVHAGCGGSMSAATYGMDYCWGGYRMKQQALRLFDRVNDSRAAFFWSTGTRDSVVDIGTFTDGVAAPKFTNKTSTGSATYATMIDTDFPVFRLAEAYLIYAEANIRGGGGSAASALGYLNALRERAYGNATHDFAALPPVDSILAERGRELLFEAKRRTDLVRFGKFSGGSYLWAWKGNAPGGTSVDAKYDLFPLPANELAANPSLVGHQNPGY